MHDRKRRCGPGSQRVKNSSTYSEANSDHAELPNFRTPEDKLQDEGVDPAFIFNRFAELASESFHKDQAYEWAKQAYEINSDYAYECSIACFEVELYEDAFDLLSEAAEKQDIRAYAPIGRFYEFGYGSLEINYQTALEYFQNSHVKGESQGTYELGRCLEEGKFVDLNLAGAIQYYYAAALKNNVDAIIALAKLYSEGKVANANKMDALCLLWSACYSKLIEFDNEKFKELKDGISTQDFNSYTYSVCPDTQNKLSSLLQSFTLNRIADDENLFEYLAGCHNDVGLNLPMVFSCRDLMTKSIFSLDRLVSENSRC